MSFSSNIKDELIEIDEMPSCCTHAMAYGMMLFGRSFNKGDISLMTDHKGVAEKYVDIVTKACDIKPDLSVSQAGKYTVSFLDKKDRMAVLSAFSSNGNERLMRIDRGNLLNESQESDDSINCCNSAFLRGAFLSCGTASDPKKSYHIEFVVPFKTLSMDLLKMITDYGLKAKHMVRRYVNVIYIKDSESIEDLLTIMGASMSSLEIMNIKIYKDLRNITNRRYNFENANLSKTVNASFDQVLAIEKLARNGAIGALSDSMKEIAKLRMENPEASLREIGEMCEIPISRSSVNHRLKKLMEMADKIETDSVEDEEIEQ